MYVVFQIWYIKSWVVVGLESAYISQKKSSKFKVYFRTGFLENLLFTTPQFRIEKQWAGFAICSAQMSEARMDVFIKIFKPVGWLLRNRRMQ